MSKPYKVILSLKSLNVSNDLKEGLVCRVSADGYVGETRDPFDGVHCFDISENVSKIQVVFSKDGAEIAKGDLVVPSEVASNTEVDTSEVMKSSTSVGGKTGRELTAEFSLTFLNSQFELARAAPSHQKQTQQTHHQHSHSHTFAKSTARQSERREESRAESRGVEERRETSLEARNQTFSATTGSQPRIQVEFRAPSATLQAESSKQELKQESSRTVPKVESKPDIRTESVVEQKPVIKVDSKKPVSSKKSSHTKTSNKKWVTSTSKVDTGRSKTPAAKEQQHPKASNVDIYLNKVVDKHFEEAKNKVQKDIGETSDCVYLNKFNQVAAAQLVNSSSLSPSRKLDETGRATSRKNLEVKPEIADDDLRNTPEKLKEKFKSNTKQARNSTRNGGGVDMTSILMDTETRRYVNEYKNQLEYLRNIVYVLDQKVVELDSYKREVHVLREDHDKCFGIREELRKTLLETSKDLKEESDRLNHLVLDLEKQNKDVLKDLKTSNNKVDDLQTRLHAQDVRIGQLEAENNELRTKVRTGEAYKSQLLRITNDHTVSEKKHADNFVHIGARLNELQTMLDDVTTDRNKLREEVNRVLNDNAEVKVQLTQEKTNNATLRDDLQTLHGKLKLNQGTIEVLKGIQDQRDAIIDEVAKLKHHNESLVSQLETIQGDIITRTKDGETGDRSLRDELLKAQRKIAELEGHLNDVKGTANKSRKENVDFRHHIITLEQLLCVKEDVYAQLESTQHHLHDKLTDNDKLRSQLDANGKIIEGLNDKIIELEKLVIYLKNGVTDKEDVTGYHNDSTS